MFNKYTDSGPNIVNVEPIVQADPPAAKWDYGKNGTDWEMDKCDDKDRGKTAMSPIDIDTTYPAPKSNLACIKTDLCYYDWTLYSGSFIPHFDKITIDDDKTGPNPPDNK